MEEERTVPRRREVSLFMKEKTCVEKYGECSSLLSYGGLAVKLKGRVEEE
jgi:hypothetical protein